MTWVRCSSDWRSDTTGLAMSLELSVSVIVLHRVDDCTVEESGFSVLDEVHGGCRPQTPTISVTSQSPTLSLACSPDFLFVMR